MSQILSLPIVPNEESKVGEIRTELPPFSNWTTIQASNDTILDLL